MAQVEESERRVRRFRSVAEKRQIVQLSMKSGASVAEVAQAHGLNANQVFKWRRAFERGELVEAGAASTALLPVTVTTPVEAEIRESAGHQQPAVTGSIRIEFPGRVTISVESGADATLVRTILESLCK